MTADDIVETLRGLAEPDELPKIRKRLAEDEEAFGLRMRDVFATAKQSVRLPLDEVHRLLDHPVYEPRLTAFCILDFQARRRLSGDERRALHDVYLERHDRITTWDMVDRAAPRVIGGYLVGRDTTVLRELAASDDPLRRRTAITAPLFFVRNGSDAELAEAFAVGARLADAPEPVVHNAVGIFCKHAGTRDERALIDFLDRHATSMARPAVRLAIEKLPAATRRRYLT